MTRIFASRGENILLSGLAFQNNDSRSRKSRLAYSEPAQVGDNLLSHQASLAVPSAPGSLTSVFGMGTGGTSQLSSPTKMMKWSSLI
jgi:hypothetical protein